MNLNEIVGKRIIYLTECHMSQEWIIRNQMYLEVFTLPFYIPDTINWKGWFEDGSYTTGTELGSFTSNSLTTTVGQGNGPGGRF